MKALLTFLLALFAVSVFAAPPIKLKAERTVSIDGAVQKNAVVLNWQAVTQFVGPAQSYEIQRQLFPWGWRAVGTANNQAQVWIDRKPAKRASWYRIRAIFDGSKSEWSRKAYVPKL